MIANPYQTLLGLVHFDARLLSLKKEAERLKREEKAIEQKIALVHEAVKGAQDSFNEVRHFLAQIDLEMAALSAEIERKEHVAKQAKSNKEYTALLHEMETVAARKPVLSEQWLEAAQQVEQREREVHEVSLRAQKDEATLQSQLQEIRELSRECDEHHAQLFDDRKSIASAVKPEWLAQYENLHSRLENPMVQVTNGTCSACGYKVPVGDLNKIHRQGLVSCQQCRRLLYDEQVGAQEGGEGA
ncbi:MAG: hypothetical protein JW725_01890 [Candidatus Babeliaceae bacterium]|nr:hypothetical protein [Candidatus Babeliaceae bacterium]